MTDHLAGFAPDELRALVREVLRDALPASLVRAQAIDGAAPRVVSLASDRELNAFAQAVARECEDPGARARLTDGTVTFRLVQESAGPEPEPGPAAAAPADDALRVEHGVVTERHVREAARAGVRLVAARGVVVTPLAKDRARSAGVDIEREG